MTRRLPAHAPTVRPAPHRSPHWLLRALTLAALAGLALGILIGARVLLAAPAPPA
jgi:hypothetical protein